MNKRIISMLMISALIISASGCDSIYVEEATTTTAENFPATTAGVTDSTTGTEATTAAEEEIIVQSVEPSVEFSHRSGVYAESFNVEISPLTDGEIYYTTDGSDPKTSESAVLYTGAVQITDRKSDKNVVSAVEPVEIGGTFCSVNKERNGFECEIVPPTDKQVDKCTVIRAVTKNTDGTYGADVQAAYFIGTAEEHIKGLAESCEASGESLAVMSISVNYDDFFDNEKGIYVKGDIFDKALEEYIEENRRVRDPETARQLDANYKQKGRAWEREASIILFEASPDGMEEVMTQNCGIRVQGNYSRSDIQKGFRLYARTDYGENNFDYAVFGDDYLNVNGDTMDKFDTLVLRNGGNCAFTAKFNDTYWQSLVEETACATQKSRPCVVYLNGEYWGLYILQEDYTNDYMEDYYGVNKDDVVIYKGDAESLALGYKLDEGDLPEGVSDETYYFHELYGFFETHSDLESEEDYNEFIKLVDPQSVMDYFAVQSWIDNKWDWPGKNWSMWKTTANDGSTYGDGRWRLMFYDMEFGGVCGEGDARNNTIKNANYKDNGLLDMNTDNPAVLCFAYLMTNDKFADDFCARLSGLSEGCFEKQRALDKLQEFEDIYGPLYEQFFERYEGTGTADDAINGGYATAKCIRDFLEKRESNIDRMIKFCEKTLE